MGFYSINCTGYLHSSPIITCTSDTDRIFFCTLSWWRLHSQHVTCSIAKEPVVYYSYYYFWLPQCSLASEWPRAVPPQECAAEDAQRRRGARGWRTTTIQNKSVCPGFERTEARTLHIPPSICSVHEFTSGGHQAGFTTGQQKHVIHRRTPYLGAYVRENQVHVPLISIIHHKLCKGAIGRAKAYEPQIKHTGLCCLTCNTIKGDNI